MKLIATFGALLAIVAVAACATPNKVEKEGYNQNESVQGYDAAGNRVK